MMMIIFRIILIIINRYKMFIKEALSRETVVPATLAVTSSSALSPSSEKHLPWNFMTDLTGG